MRRTWILAGVAVAGAMVVGAVVGPRTVVSDDTAKATYIGADGCKKCHLKTHKEWKETGMAKTFEALKPGQAAEAKTKAGLDPNTDYTKDEKCLKCHTTGYGTESGYPAAGKDLSPDEQKRAEKLAGVGCEACHGPGSLYGPYKKDNPKYKKADVEKLGLHEPTAETCQPCHVKECPTMPADYAFDFEKAKKESGKLHAPFQLKEAH
jgi:hypothetical protein